MSLILKLLPLAAIGLVLAANKGALERNFQIVDKVRVVTTATIEIKSVAEAVYLEWLESDTLPLENFSQFLRENTEEAKGGDRRDRANDVWGTPYRLARVRTGFEIRCAGPDKTWNSADDISFFRKLEGAPDVGATAMRQRVSASGLPLPRAVTRGASAASRPQSSQLPDATKQKVLEFQQKRAAEGSATAQFDLGMRYLAGDGVEKDEATARSWLQKAAANGNSQATKKLRELDAK